MDQEQERNHLEVLFRSILNEYETTLDKADDLTTHSPAPSTRRLRAWLQNVISSLISWSVDIRLDNGSLSAIEGTDLGVGVSSLLQELREQLDRIWTGNPHEKDALSEMSGPGLPSFSPEHEESHDRDIEAPNVTIPRLLYLLQDAVQPIRMEHAMRRRGGPYAKMKDHIDRMFYSQLRDSDQDTDRASISSISSREDDARYDNKEQVEVSRPNSKSIPDKSSDCTIPLLHDGYKIDDIDAKSMEIKQNELGMNDESSKVREGGRLWVELGSKRRKIGR